MTNVTSMFGERLAEERKRLKLSQTELGSQLGVSKRSVLDWEADAASPKADYLVKMSGLGIDVTYVLTGHHVGPALLQQLASTSQVITGIEPVGGPMTEETICAHTNAGKAAAQIAQISGALSSLQPEDLSIVKELVVRLYRGHVTKKGKSTA